MKKLESTWYNMVGVLTAIAVVAGIALAYVNSITREPIAAIQKHPHAAISGIIAGEIPIAGMIGNGFVKPFKRLIHDFYLGMNIFIANHCSNFFRNLFVGEWRINIFYPILYLLFSQVFLTFASGIHFIYHVLHISFS